MLKLFSRQLPIHLALSCLLDWVLVSQNIRLMAAASMELGDDLNVTALLCEQLYVLCNSRESMR